jgi:integrase/recombinase XerC
VTPEALAWIERFGAHLGSERRLSPHTRSNYLREIDALVSWCDTQRLTAWAQLDAQHLRSFAARSHAGGLAPRSIQRRLSAIRSFMRFLLREHVIRDNPGLDVRAPKSRRRLPRTLDADQMGKLLEIPGDDPLSRRDRAIMELFYSSGLRLSELCALTLVDLDLADRTVRVTGKGGKTRILPVGARAITALREWLAERASFAKNAGTALFVGANGRSVSPRTIQTRVARRAREQALQPVRRREGIGIDQGQPLALGLSGAEIDPGGEAQVGARRNQGDPGNLAHRRLRRAVGGGVVDQQDLKGRQGLAGQGRQAAGQIGARLPGDHDDADRALGRRPGVVFRRVPRHASHPSRPRRPCPGIP